MVPRKLIYQLHTMVRRINLYFCLSKDVCLTGWFGHVNTATTEKLLVVNATDRSEAVILL